MWWPSHQLGGRSQPSQMQPFVAEGDGSADGGGEGSGFAADVQDFAVAAEDGGDDFGVAEESAGLGGAQGSAGVVGGVLMVPVRVSQSRVMLRWGRSPPWRGPAPASR